MRAHQDAKEAARVAPHDANVNMAAIVSLLTSERAVDTLLWQMLASVAIPGFTIHQVVHFTHLLLNSTMHLDEPERIPATFAAAIAGIAAIAGQPVGEVCNQRCHCQPTLRKSVTTQSSGNALCCR
jgi:hypothetical protein